MGKHKHYNHGEKSSNPHKLVEKISNPAKPLEKLSNPNSAKPLEQLSNPNSTKSLPSAGQTSGIQDKTKHIPSLATETSPKSHSKLPSIWDLVKAQVCFSELAQTSTNPDQKHERIYNFLHVPQKLEKFLFVGYFICLDSFLYNLTILPLRIVVSLVQLLLSTLRLWKPRINKFAIGFDFIQGLMLVLVTYLLLMLNSSRLYHSIRGQSVLKLYVIYNVFEILDKLCCSVGLDILDSFFSRSNLSNGGEYQSLVESHDSNSRLGPLTHFFLSICYIFIHSVVLLYQVITLNVSINSFSNALLTLLVSNQFVEIKSAVFKKFEKENLFQLACADVVERFQLVLYIIIIGARNVSEIGINMDSDYLLNGLIIPLALVYISEILVDWLKHAFISKFNHIHPDVYTKFLDILCRDMVVLNTTASKHHVYLDQSPTVSRRIGFSVFPLTCLVLRIIIQIFNASFANIRWYHLIFAFVSLLGLKIVVGVFLCLYCLKRTCSFTDTLTTKSSCQHPTNITRTSVNVSQSNVNDKSSNVDKSSSLDTIDRFTLFKSRIT